MKHLTITREERLYDSSSDQTIYAKKTISTDGIEQTRNEEEWIIEVTPNGKKGHMLYQDQTDVATHGTYITVNNVAIISLSIIQRYVRRTSVTATTSIIR